MSRLLYVGQQTADLLADSVDENLERYSSLGFDDLEASGDWRIPLSVHGDLALLNGLNPEKGQEAEVHNSMLVGRALANLTPSLARENRIWIRLSHVEALSFARARWLTGIHQETLAKAVRTHFFASTWTGCRDDHAISRLWWNHHIASKICSDEPEAVLSLILSRADLRANLVERSRVGTRLQLSRAIVSELRDNDALRSSEPQFRKFMKLLNAQGAGQYVEVWSEDKLKAFVSECAVYAWR
ncbi:DUF6339 family protein [Aerolutibacter ruishenii]|uniref:Uncharacterized protein n=1 Tax=Aerolutibacter ruishenii TaxID=686800 RepID=A0A562LWQ7_9GAMM|nr:DUF6339 family protein [Lysobacter ruishenii]TWI11983.1 hypothetical protein IP93_01264 [Lysobacter ruishenii]